VFAEWFPWVCKRIGMGSILLHVEAMGIMFEIF
jgi:hypothetical protein